jgi:mitochondrial fission protein ELM1
LQERQADQSVFLVHECDWPVDRFRLDRDGRVVSAKTTMRDEARDSTHVVSRALVLSNGALGAEGQCLGLARALGFHDPEVHLVGEAALALAPRFSAAWSEKVGVDGARDGTRDRALALSVGAAQMVRRARRRVHPMPRACSAAAKLLRLLPASLHVRLHALWERVFGKRFDEVWLGADLAQVTAALRNLPQNSGRKAKTLVLASGRGAIPAAAAVRRRHADDAFVVVAQHPRVSLAAFDAVVAPKHDFANAKKNASRLFLRADDGGLDGELPAAVIETEGALHRFDDAFVRLAHESWRFFFSSRPAPRLAVAIGGPTRLCRFGKPETFAAELVDQISNAFDSTHFKSACVAFSARTPEAVKRAVERALEEKGLLFIYSASAEEEEGRVMRDEEGGFVSRRVVVVRSPSDPANAPSLTKKKKIGLAVSDPNLYAGAMAWADGVLVTADSCSMLSEALALGVPVFVARFAEAKGKMSRFLAAAATRGACVDAATVFVSSKNQTPSGDAAAERLARFVRYRRSVLLARSSTADAEISEKRPTSGDLQTVAARLCELVAVRSPTRAEPFLKRRLLFEADSEPS